MLGVARAGYNVRIQQVRRSPVSRISSKVFVVGILGLLALVAWGCFGSDEGASEQLAAAAVPAASTSLEVSSTAFSEIRPRKRIPRESSCYGANVSPPLDWSGVSANAKSLALIVEEPEERLSSVNKQNYSFVPSGGSVHWLLFNIPSDATTIAEGIPTTTGVLPDGSIQGMNSFGQIGYSGPCPSPSVVVYWTSNKQSSDSPREYYFRLYALDSMLDLAAGATKADLTAAMEGHIVASGETLGKFQGPRQQGWFTDSGGTPIPNTPAPVP